MENGEKMEKKIKWRKNGEKMEKKWRKNGEKKCYKKYFYIYKYIHG